jgi:predicted DNA-binding transcriptional regulator AlpA
MSKLRDVLPADLGRDRLLDSEQSAEFCGFSLAHWRRLYRAKKVPAPVKLSDRKYGWRVGALADFIAEKARAA